MIEPYRYADPRPSEPFEDVNRFERQLRRSAQRRDNVLAACKVFALGFGVLVGLAILIAIVASFTEDADKCHRKGGAIIDGQCVKVIPL
jgi:hypothetical protein